MRFSRLIALHTVLAARMQRKKKHANAKTITAVVVLRRKGFKVTVSLAVLI